MKIYVYNKIDNSLFKILHEVNNIKENEITYIVNQTKFVTQIPKAYFKIKLNEEETK